MAFARIVAEIKFLRLWECGGCGREAKGSTESMSFDHSDPDAIAPGLKKIQPRAQSMPDGWASYYATKRDFFLCQTCVPKHAEAYEEAKKGHTYSEAIEILVSKGWPG